MAKDGNGLATVVTALVTISEVSNQTKSAARSIANNLPTLAIHPAANGGVAIKIMGTPGVAYLLEHSADLRTWEAFPDLPSFKMPDSGVTNCDNTTPLNPRSYPLAHRSTVMACEVNRGMDFKATQLPTIEVIVAMTRHGLMILDSIANGPAARSLSTACTLQ